MDSDRLAQQVERMRAEIADLRRDVEAMRRQCERLLELERSGEAALRQVDSIPAEEMARGDEAPRSALFPGPERP